MLIKSHFSRILCFIFLVGCGSKSSFTPDNSGTDDSIQGNGDPGESAIGTLINNRNIEDIMCREGKQAAIQTKKSDFNPQFDILCDGEKSKALFAQMINNAYQGVDKPVIHVHEFSYNELYVTKLSFLYAMKVPLQNPSLFADLRAHDIFKNGIKTERSEMSIVVQNREAFPGEASIEKIVLDYDLPLATGAYIYDKRTTEFNTYQVIEGNSDISLSTEYLLNPEQNEYYHMTNSLIMGLKGKDGNSYFVFINDFTLKNRIDPERLKNTLLSVNESVVKMLYEHITANAQ